MILHQTLGRRWLAPKEKDTPSSPLTSSLSAVITMSSGPTVDTTNRQRQLQIQRQRQSPCHHLAAITTVDQHSLTDKDNFRDRYKDKDKDKDNDKYKYKDHVTIGCLMRSGPTNSNRPCHHWL